MKILIGCEESQTVCKAFRELGHEAYSCDILPCTGNRTEWHFQDDIIQVVNGWFDMNEVVINDNFALKFDVWNDVHEYEYKDHRIKQIGWNWDLLIAHPPCTYLSMSGNKWRYNKDGSRNEERFKQQTEALNFVRSLMLAPVKRIAIENPISVISTFIRKPDQIVQPWMFGDSAQKSTCLWLKNLPLLRPTKIVEKGNFVKWQDNKTGKTKKQPEWYYNAFRNAKSPEERKAISSKTFTGIALAMAEQWGDLTNYNDQLKLF